MFNEYPKTQTDEASYVALFQVVMCRTSQQRTRSRKRMTSLCFFFCSSSRYLWAPICAKCRVSQCFRGFREWASAARRFRSACSCIAIIDCSSSSSRADVPCRYLACIGGVPFAGRQVKVGSSIQTFMKFQRLVRILLPRD
jgi:hypothetical protein